METSLNFSSRWPDFKCASAKVEWWLHPLFLHPWQVEPGHIGHIGHIQHLAPNHRLAEVGPPPSRSSHPPEDFVDQQSCWFLYIFAASLCFLRILCRFFMCPRFLSFYPTQLFVTNLFSAKTILLEPAVRLVAGVQIDDLSAKTFLSSGFQPHQIELQL